MKYYGAVFQRLELFCTYFLEEKQRGGTIMSSFCQALSSFIQLVKSVTRSFAFHGHPSSADVVAFTNWFKPYILYLEQLTNCKIVPDGFTSFAAYASSGFASFPRGVHLFTLLYQSLQVSSFPYPSRIHPLPSFISSIYSPSLFFIFNLHR